MVANEYKNLRLKNEDVAEFEYRPRACKKTYRLVVVRKNLSVEKGELVLYDDIRYCFYLSAPCKGTGLQRVRTPPGNWIAPAGSNRSGIPCKEAAEAFGVKVAGGDRRACRPLREGTLSRPRKESCGSRPA